MDLIETLNQDLREGRISAERLVDLVVDLCGKLEAANQRIDELNQRIEDLEKQGDGTQAAKYSGPRKLDHRLSYSGGPAKGG